MYKPFKMPVRRAVHKNGFKGFILNIGPRLSPAGQARRSWASGATDSKAVIATDSVAVIATAGILNIFRGLNLLDQRRDLSASGGFGLRGGLWDYF